MRKVKVVIALPLSDALRKKVEAFFTGKLGDVQFEYETDASILGGIKVVDGDRVYDGTLSTQLQKMKRSLE